MAGITDQPFRDLVTRFGAGLVVSEMIADHEMIRARPGTRERAELGAEVENTAVQIVGREAHRMAEAARMLADHGARIIDINMGCPARKVTSGLSGSALLREPDHALRLIEAVVAAVEVPVTLKTRLGWDDDMKNAPEVVAGAEKAGIAMVTVHGRTRCQFYRGHADWAAIGAVREAVTIPVIANGDIGDATAARQAIRDSGAAGVMVGRAVRGRPWLLAAIRHDLFGTPAPHVPQGAALTAMVQEHYEAMIGFYGRDLGVRVARKHLGWYMTDAGTPPDLRRRILTAECPQAVLALLADALTACDATPGNGGVAA